MKRTVSKFLVGALALSGALVAISAGPAYAVNCNHQPFHQGNTGHCVSDIQYIMNFHNSPQAGPRGGHAPLVTVDGIYGSITAFVWGDWQQGFEPVTGAVSISDWSTLLCPEAGHESYFTDPYLITRQAALAAKDAGCHIDLNS